MDARARRVFRQVVKTQVRSGSQTLMRCIKSAARAVFLDHLCGGEARSTGPQGDRQGCRFLFRQDRSPVEKPGLGSRTWRAQPGKRQVGCRFLLGTSLLDKQKRSTSRFVGVRKLCFKNTIQNEI